MMGEGMHAGRKAITVFLLGKIPDKLLCSHKNPFRDNFQNNTR